MRTPLSSSMVTWLLTAPSFTATTAPRSDCERKCLGSFRCEHDIGGLDYRIALFAFGKLQLLYRFHGDICFDGVVVPRQITTTALMVPSLTSLTVSLIWLRTEIFVLSSFVFK